MVLVSTYEGKIHYIRIKDCSDKSDNRMDLEPFEIGLTLNTLTKSIYFLWKKVITLPEHKSCRICFPWDFFKTRIMRENSNNALVFFICVRILT